MHNTACSRPYLIQLLGSQIRGCEELDKAKGSEKKVVLKKRKKKKGSLGGGGVIFHQRFHCV